jgi:hypothetical protein
MIDFIYDNDNITERLCQKNPIFSKNRIFSGAHKSKKSDFFKKSDF